MRRTEEQKKARRELYARLKVEGVCTVCQKRPATHGFRCEECTTRANELYQQRSVARPAVGLCTIHGCPNPPKPGCKFCAEHIEKNSSATKKRRAERIAAGMCADCGENPIAIELCQTQCVACYTISAVEAKTQAEKWQTLGGCTACGTRDAAPGHKLCQVCLDRGMDQYWRLRKEILAAYGGPVCVGCGETEVAILQVDHVNSDGAAHRRAIGGSNKLYNWLKRNGFPNDPPLRVLCPNCNIRAFRGLPLPNERETALAQEPESFDACI